jgi:hypothetical protein
MVGLVEENVKRLKLVELTFEAGKPVVLIGGRNAQGKPERVFACVRYAVKKSKRNLAGMVRRALEQGWTL